MTRFETRQDARDQRAYTGWTKPVLVEALRNVQELCPPRVSAQAKAELLRIARGALDLADGHPLKLKMQVALADARTAIAAR